jgi:serine/threonine protein kinase
MITPRSADFEFDDGDHDDEHLSPSASTISDIQFWIDHPSLDDLTAAQSEPDRQQVRRDVEKCIRLLKIPATRLSHEDGQVDSDSSTQRYTILKLLGVGAFGVVLHAKDRTLNREVAIKILRPSVLLSKRARARFSMEGEALAKCNCQGIVPIHEVGQIEGNPYLVMGLIQGKTLAEYIKCQESPIAPRLAARIVVEIANAVHRAHQRGVLHRDLKPSNVLLEPNDNSRSELPGNLFVSDFGLAKDLLPNSEGSQGNGSTDSPIIGTIRYMSPEQATGQSSEVSVTSDVYSLGVILYELLTLKCPFSGTNTYEIIHQVVSSQAKAPRQINALVSKELDAIVGRCLSKLPSARYQSAGELSADLQRYLDGKPVIAKPAGPIKATVFWAKRNPSLAIASAVIWFGLMFSTIAISVLYQQNLKNLQAAEASRKFTLKAIDSSFRYTAEEILHNVPQSNSLKLQLHQKALEINAELATQRGFDEESTNRLSIAHHLVANDALNCYQFELASFHRERCLELLGELAERHPKNAKYQFYIFSNQLLSAQGSMSNAEYLAWLFRAREHLHSAMSLAPNNPDYEDADAALCHKLAFVDSKNSEEWLNRSIRNSAELGRRFPDKPHYFKHAISGHNAMAQIAIKATEWEKARQHCADALAIIDAHYRKSHDNADILTAYVTTFEFYAQALENTDIPKAIEVYDQFAVEAAKLEVLDLKYKFYRMLRASARLSQAKLKLKLGDTVASQVLFTDALAILKGYAPIIDSDVAVLADLKSRIEEFELLLNQQ